jgi:GNAT superfamily N-acetyltransferase
VLRAMAKDDAEAAVGLMETVWGMPVTDRPYGIRRMHHLVTTDPGGAWVSVGDDGSVDGVALSIVREGIWGLSLLIVDPLKQSGGIGRALMDATLAYGEGTRGGIILASDDPRALRTYWRAGFALRPTFDARGSVTNAPPADPAVREGRWPEDRAMLDEISRAVRGAAHGRDLEPYLVSGLRLRVHDDGGFAVHALDGRVRLVAATDERVARALLETVLHDTPTAEVDFLDAQQDWAIDVVLTAGLRLIPNGATCVRGELGPLRPYVPSGAYL